MREGPNAKAERERQQREQRMFLATAGVGFTAALLAAVGIGHRRAHKRALIEGEAIDKGQARIVMKAFGLGTLYAFTIFGCGLALGNYYLKSKGISSMREFAEYMRGSTTQLAGGTFREKLNVDEKEDQRALDKVDQMLFEVDESTGEKKIKFARVKGLLGSSSSDESRDKDGGGQKQRLSIGARMRAFFGFGKDKGSDL